MPLCRERFEYGLRLCHTNPPVCVHLAVHDGAAVKQLRDVEILGPLEADLVLNDLDLVTASIRQ